MVNFSENTEVKFQSAKINNIIEQSNPIEQHRKMSVCMANQYVAKPLLSWDILSQVFENQHPVVLGWLMISMILFCSMFVYTNFIL